MGESGMIVSCSTSVRCNSSLEKALADIEAAGMHYVDVLAIDGWVHIHTRDLVDDFETVFSRLDSLLRQHHLTPAALNTGAAPQLHHRSEQMNAQRRREIEALVRLTQRLGVSVAAIQPRSTDRQRPYADVLADCVATLREQMEIGARAGVTFALELHVNSPFETLEQARMLLAELPDLPLVYDPTHFVMQGIDIRETGWLMKNARHIHLRDAAPGHLQVPLGAGLVDFDWLLGALRDQGYRGYFSIEYLETDEFDVMDSARRLYDLVSARFPP
jgi:sugar phosphate isomerase/epimerase